jgi:hypothetical protein
MPAPKQNPALVAAAIATALRLAKASKMAKTASSVAKKPVVKVQPELKISPRLKFGKIMNAKSNVKVVKNVKSDAKELGMSKKEFQTVANKSMSDMARRNKSGQSAKEVAALEKIRNKNVPKKPTIKITGK